MIKANKTTNNEVSISMKEVVELVRSHLNLYGSKETGMHICIPENSNWEIDRTADQDSLAFRWTEKV